jgi:hypothetical protein
MERRENAVVRRCFWIEFIMGGSAPQTIQRPGFSMPTFPESIRLNGKSVSAGAAVPEKPLDKPKQFAYSV